MILISCLCGFMGLPTYAQTCPPPLEYADRKAAIFENLQTTRDASAGRMLSRSLLSLYARAPNMQAQALLDEGMARRQNGDLEGAAALFGELIAYCPDYAEGYNQRAFVKFLQRNYRGAVSDLNSALTHEPEHPGAMAGRAMALMRLGQIGPARQELRRALALNPWLPERQMLIDPPGQDI